MKNKLSKVGCVLLMLGSVGLASCNTNTSNGISDEDKAFPSGKNNLDYMDYALGDDAFDTDKWYKNNLKDMQLPDPFVLEEGDEYYIYGTTDRTAANSFDCYKTTDFINFTQYKDIYKPSSSSYTYNSLFAPEVYKFDGKYYMYYSGKNSAGVQAINVLVSDTPYGGFVEYKGKDAFGGTVDYTADPMIKDIKSGLSLGILDQTLLVDGDDIYMYYSVYQTGIMQYIVGLQMYDPVTPDWDTYKILVRPGEPTPATTGSNILSWEAQKEFKVAEGPCVIKSPVNNKYYLTYSVNHYPDRFYTVCYAVSDKPLGDYTKPYTKGETWTNILFGYAGAGVGTVYDQWDGFMSGTAHHSIFKVGNEYMIVYHAHKNRSNSDSGRMVAFDHVYFDENGVPYTHGPTYSLSPLPTKISGYENVALKSTVKVENIDNKDFINDNYIVEHYQLVQENTKEVKVKKGKSYIELDLDKEYEIGGIQIFNSATYEKALEDVKFIKFSDNEYIVNGAFPEQYLKEDKEFIFPGSAFTYDFADIKTKKIIIGFDTTEAKQFNEIAIYGKA